MNNSRRRKRQEEKERDSIKKETERIKKRR